MSPAGLAAACHRRPFQRRDLLPVPRKPLQLRPGEQNLHRDSAPPPAAGGLYSGAICSPPPRKALRLRSGEQNLHTDSAPPPGVGRLFSGAICSPPLANPCGSVPGSKFFTEIPRRRLPPAAFSAARFAPRPPQSLAASFGEQNLHRNSAPVRATGDSCWRCPAGKRLYHRRATPTGRPESRPAADPVGAAPPAKP